ncbi:MULTISPECIES: DUF962 domain-containing protein [unclassified Thalassolituus]|jgi:uncharacterized membrane protein YGL010W|uniref:Mpo1 family 2-hydroxy fatty acid dioxygenase n=1 Tax=Oceanospirillaceae TaxID=135620 RepID=UPI001190DF44|nr:MULTISPECIES: Mpo1-like protein [unclassified Thalassolituus]TVV45284.1 DUF962 domain-containing protein [Thalassolituus sp. C2-1]
MNKKTADQWFEEYGASHQNPLNKLIHWICVPLIFIVIMGLLWEIPVPATFTQVPYLNWATLSAIVVVGFYVRMSFSLSVGLTAFTIATYALIAWFEQLNLAPLWAICAGSFVVLWILQFIGHYIEGKKPSFFKDIQFLLIGPAWLMGFIYRKLGIPYS